MNVIEKNAKNIDDIDLFNVINNVWDGRYIVILLTVFFFILGNIYYYQLDDNYKLSLDLRKSKDTEFIKFLPINKFFNEYELNEIIDMNTNNGKNENSVNKINQLNQINKETIFNRFVEEFLDYEELVQVLQNDPKIINELKNLSDQEKNFKLYNYAGRFKIVNTKIKNQQDFSTIFFEWDNKEEGSKIIDQTLNLVLTNLQNSIFREIDEFLRIKRYVDLNSDLIRIDRLLEQSEIAKELNIVDNLNPKDMDRVNLSNSNVSFNINTSGSAYYLRGYKAIDKEIKLIKNRKYRELENFEKELDTLRKSNIKLIDYNLFKINAKSLKTSRNKIWLGTIFAGFVSGVFLVLLFKSYQRRLGSIENSIN